MAFEVTQRVDEKGVVLVTFTGTWDSEEWSRQISEVWRSLPEGFDPEGRPILTDITDCAFPDIDWVGHFKKIALKLAQRRKQPFRRAILIRKDGFDEGPIGVRLFDAVHKTWHHPKIDSRPFTDRQAAYSWLTENWPADPA